MARIVVQLTVLEIDASDPKEKEYTLFDGNGLMLVIKPDVMRTMPDGTVIKRNGAKTWIYRFKSPEDGKEKKITIGQYLPKNKGVSLKEAREERDRLKSQLKEGTLPTGKSKLKSIEEKQIDGENDKQITKILDDFLEYHGSVLKRNAGHLQRQKRRMEMYVLPHLLSKNIDEITKKQIINCVKQIDPKYNETAHRLLTLCGQIWSWACDNGRVEHNIIADINKKHILPPLNEDNHYPTITDAKRIKELLLAIQDYKGDPSTRFGLQLAPYLALRPKNIRFAEWDEFDFEKKLWDIPAEKMKTKRRHIMPLTDMMIEIILKAAPYSKHRSKYLFPSPVDPTKPISENTLNFGLKRLGFGEEIVTHGFRGMFSTVANEHRNVENGHKADRDIIEFHLAHTVQSKVAEAYNHADYIEQRRELVQWWSDYLDGLKTKKFD